MWIITVKKCYGANHARKGKDQFVPLDQFALNGGRKEGLQASCRTCVAVAQERSAIDSERHRIKRELTNASFKAVERMMRDDPKLLITIAHTDLDKFKQYLRDEQTKVLDRARKREPGREIKRAKLRERLLTNPINPRRAAELIAV